MLNKITNKVLSNIPLTRAEADYISAADIKELCIGADKIRRHFKGNKINLCSIINGKSGNCSENCKFCAQSAHYNTDIKCYGFLDSNTIVKDCIEHYNKGVHRYSIVTSGRALNNDEFEKALAAYKKIHNSCTIGICASHGFLSYEQFKMLKEAGVTRYHCNIETSKEYFKNICTTHTFEQKLETINNAKRAGLEICSGGIIGMGESMSDRISMAFSLAKLQVSSIPINALTPIKNTPFENNNSLSEENILRTIAIFRYINPKAQIRIAAGRRLLKNNGIAAFFSGADSAITGDYLTTTGSTIAADKNMLINNGFEL